MRSIALRSFQSASKARFVGDLFRIYSVARREQAGFNWVTMPNGVELAGNALFDPVRMRALYELGYDNALAGNIWSTVPPGLRVPSPP